MRLSILNSVNPPLAGLDDRSRQQTLLMNRLLICGAFLASTMAQAAL